MSRSIASLEEDDTLISASPLAPPFDLLAYGATDIGLVRKTNEDSFAVARHLGLFLVADGMGGAAAGEVASRMAIEQVQRAVEDGETTWPTDSSLGSPESGPRRFISGIHRANRQIHKAAAQDWRRRGMGTTFVGLLVLSRSAVVAHVGDSRLYRFRDGVLTRMTRDHSLANHLVDRGLLPPEEAARHPKRNILTRAVGTHEVVEVDTRILDVRPGDAFLLCSDGLHGELTDEEIAAVLRDPSLPAGTVERLVDLALEKGGGDNVTALLVRLDAVHDGGRPPIPPAHG